MLGRRLLPLALLSIVASTAGLACNASRQKAQARPPTTVPVPATLPTTVAAVGGVFHDPRHGVHAEYADGAWWPRPIKEEEILALIPVDRPPTSEKPQMTIEVPTLPANAGAFLPIGMIADRYVSALKNDFADVKVDERSEVKLPEATARRIVTTVHEKGTGAPGKDVAVLAVHAGRVYIFSCDADDADYPATRAAFDAMMASVKWVK